MKKALLVLFLIIGSITVSIAQNVQEVVYLKRIQFGTLTLDPSLKPGQYRKLTEEEVEQLC